MPFSVIGGPEVVEISKTVLEKVTVPSDGLTVTPLHELDCVGNPGPTNEPLQPHPVALVPKIIPGTQISSPVSKLKFITNVSP